MSEPVTRTPFQTYVAEPWAESSNFFFEHHQKGMHLDDLASQIESYNVEYYVRAAEPRFTYCEIAAVEWAAAVWELIEAVIRFAIGVFALMSGDTEPITQSLCSVVCALAHMYFSAVGTLGVINPKWADTLNNSVKDWVVSMLSNAQVKAMLDDATLGATNLLRNVVQPKADESGDGKSEGANESNRKPAVKEKEL